MATIESSASLSAVLDPLSVINEADILDGFSADEIFQSNDVQSLTFDDLIALPGAISFGVHEVDLSARVSRNYAINTPLCSSPMDTVTEHEMAIGTTSNLTFFYNLYYFCPKIM